LFLDAVSLPAFCFVEEGAVGCHFFSTLLGVCSFASFGFAIIPETIRDLLNSRYGWQVGTDILQVLGRQTLSLEREFNRRAGFTQAHDRLPEYMTREPLPPHDAVFDVPEEDLDGVFDW